MKYIHRNALPKNKGLIIAYFAFILISLYMIQSVFQMIPIEELSGVKKNVAASLLFFTYITITIMILPLVFWKLKQNLNEPKQTLIHSAFRQWLFVAMPLAIPAVGGLLYLGGRLEAPWIYYPSALFVTALMVFSALTSAYLINFILAPIISSISSHSRYPIAALYLIIVGFTAVFIPSRSALHQDETQLFTSWIIQVNSTEWLPHVWATEVLMKILDGFYPIWLPILLLLLFSLLLAIVTFGLLSDYFLNKQKYKTLN